MSPVTSKAYPELYIGTVLYAALDSLGFQCSKADTSQIADCYIEMTLTARDAPALAFVAGQNRKSEASRSQRNMLREAISSNLQSHMCTNSHGSALCR